MRVQLIRAQSKHTEFIYNLYCNESIKRGHGMHKNIPGPHWRNIIQGLYEGWQHIFIITNGVIPIGHVGFQDLSKEDRRAEVIVTITPDMQNQGIGYEALNQIIDLGLEPTKEGGLGLESLWAGIIEDNVASNKLFDKCGFTQSGSIPDYFRFGPKTLSRVMYHLRAS